MVSSSTAFSSGQHPRPDLGDLHHFVMDVAANHVDIPKIPSAFIGPARPTSTCLGEETVLAGPSSETAVPIMFRCVWGPGNHSRHVLVRMKPSVSEQALGLRLCQRLDIPTTGAVTIEPVIKWIPGLMPYRSGIDKGKPLSNNPLMTVPRTNWLLVLIFAEVVQALGSSLSGIVDLDVLICDRQFDHCTLCDNGAVLDSAVMRNARTWGIGEGRLGERCAVRADIPGSFS